MEYISELVSRQYKFFSYTYLSHEEKSEIFFSLTTAANFLMTLTQCLMPHKCVLILYYICLLYANFLFCCFIPLDSRQEVVG